MLTSTSSKLFGLHVIITISLPEQVLDYSYKLNSKHMLLISSFLNLSLNCVTFSDAVNPGYLEQFRYFRVNIS